MLIEIDVKRLLVMATNAISYLFMDNDVWLCSMMQYDGL